jgi:hypothetical protein
MAPSGALLKPSPNLAGTGRAASDARCSAPMPHAWRAGPRWERMDRCSAGGIAPPGRCTAGGVARPGALHGRGRCTAWIVHRVHGRGRRSPRARSGRVCRAEGWTWSEPRPLQRGCNVAQAGPPRRERSGCDARPPSAPCTQEEPCRPQQPPGRRSLTRAGTPVGTAWRRLAGTRPAGTQSIERAPGAWRSPGEGRCSSR